MDAEFWQVSPGDVILAPFWPLPVTVEAAQASARFALVHWSAPGMAGVSLLSQHAAVTILHRWNPDLCGRYTPREIPAAAALADAIRTQYLAGITGTRDNSALVEKWAVEADMLALSRGQYRQPQSCGCTR